MQYANIIVDHKAGYEPFTYAIPAPVLAHVAVGSIVRVPVGKTGCHGVIANFVRRVEPKLAAKLKPISGVVYPGPFVPAYLLNACQKLHERFAYGLSDTLFPLLPQLPKRPQPDLVRTIPPLSNYRAFEYSIPLVDRPEFYAKLARTHATRNHSLLVICASHAAAAALAKQLASKLTVVLFPGQGTDKAKRDYYFKSALPSEPTVFIGTRGALMTPLDTIGGVLIDEPWLPAQKEDNAPKWWSAFAAESLCQARGIPLYLVTSLPWPESRLVRGLRAYQTHANLGTYELAPRRPLLETIATFLADCDGPGKKLAIVLREESREVKWCTKCRKEVSSLQCGTCKQPVFVIPQLTRDAVQQILNQSDIDGAVTLLTPDAAATFRRYDAILALNYDAFLSVADFRATCYLATLLHHLRSQADRVLFITSRPDEWTPISQRDTHYFKETEIQLRKQYTLPPYSTTVHLYSTSRDSLEKALNNQESATLKQGKVRAHKGEFSLSVLLKPGAPIPVTWQTTRGVKVDVFPNYVE